MKPKTKFFTVCFIELALMLLDGALTYINTPDLKNEGNPLVSVFGFGWIALFLANLIFYILYIILAYFLFFKYKPPVLQVRNIKEYISQLYYNRPDKFVWFFYKWPKNWRPLVAIIAYMYIFPMIAARMILVFEWLMVTFNIEWNLYEHIQQMMPFSRMDIVVGFILMIYLYIYWLYKEYRNNQKNWKIQQEYKVEI